MLGRLHNLGVALLELLASHVHQRLLARVAVLALSGVILGAEVEGLHRFGLPFEKAY